MNNTRKNTTHRIPSRRSRTVAAGPRKRSKRRTSPALTDSMQTVAQGAQTMAHGAQTMAQGAQTMAHGAMERMHEIAKVTVQKIKKVAT